MFLTVRLYRPFDRPVSGSEQVILVAVREATITVLFTEPFVIVTVALVLKLDPFTVNGNAAVFVPDVGLKLLITGSPPGESTVKGFVASGAPWFETVRLYRPGVTPVSRTVQTILVSVSEVTDPGTRVLPLTRDILAPAANFDPVIVITGVSPEYPLDGLIEVITGAGLFTVKIFC